MRLKRQQALALINRINMVSKLFSARPDKRDKYVREIISEKPHK